MRIDLYCFPSKLERQPSKCQNFEAQSHSLFSRCLRLATTITGSHPRLATGGWLDLTRQAFHLLDYSPLSGRTIPIFRSLRLPNKREFVITFHTYWHFLQLLYRLFLIVPWKFLVTQVQHALFYIHNHLLFVLLYVHRQ